MSGPPLSVVIASHNAAAVIGTCLEALSTQSSETPIEIIVADSSNDGTADLVRERFPEVRLVHVAASRTVPELRAIGLAAAGGEIVAFLDPYCVVANHWAGEMVRLHAAHPDAAIGGAVELWQAESQSVVNWATYFCEYGAFMLPLDILAGGELPGSNIGYKREALGHTTTGSNGFWKTFVNRRIKAEGGRLLLVPTLLVQLNKPIPGTEFFRSRYHHGRCYASMRGTTMSRPERWLRAATSPLVPSVSLWRQVRSVWPKHRHRRRFLQTVPLLLLFHSSWAWGEVWGYVRGPGGSCAQLFY